MALLNLNSFAGVGLEHTFEHTHKPLRQSRGRIAVQHEVDLSLHELHGLVVEVVVGMVEGDQLDEDQPDREEVSFVLVEFSVKL